MSQASKTRRGGFQFSLGKLMLWVTLWAGFLSSVLIAGPSVAVLVAAYLLVGWSIPRR